MAAPTVTLYINSGTDISPNWTQITTSMAFYFAGPSTTASVLASVTAPATGTKGAEQLWGANYPTYGSGTKCSTYDGTANTNKNVLGVLFSTNPTATAPILTSWDDATHTTTNDEMLAGTALGMPGLSWLKAIETTNGAPGAAWCSALTIYSGAHSPNMLQGNASYVQCVAAATANEMKVFNIVCFVPYDAASGITGHTPQLTVQYTYT